MTGIRKAGKPSGKPGQVEASRALRASRQDYNLPMQVLIFPLPRLVASLMKFRAILIYKLKRKDCQKERGSKREGGDEKLKLCELDLCTCRLTALSLGSQCAIAVEDLPRRYSVI